MICMGKPGYIICVGCVTDIQIYNKRNEFALLLFCVHIHKICRIAEYKTIPPKSTLYFSKVGGLAPRLPVSTVGL